MWIPQPEGFINATLPGELARCQVVTVCSENVCIAKILSIPFNGRTHTYAKGQAVGLLRDVDEMCQEVWRVVSEAEMTIAIERDRQEAEERRRAKEEEEALARAKAPMPHAFTVTGG